MDLSKWAHAQGIHVQTAHRWFQEGTLPIAVQKAGRLILVSPKTAREAARKAEGDGLYARASWLDQKSGLDGQVARLSGWPAEAGLPVGRVEARVGAGMDGLRAKVPRLLPDPVVTGVVAGHRDRLGRRNTELAAAALSAHSRRLVIPGSSGVTGGVAEVLTWFCTRLYGCWPARDRALKAAGCARQDNGPRTVRLQVSGGGV